MHERLARKKREHFFHPKKILLGAICLWLYGLFAHETSAQSQETELLCWNISCSMLNAVDSRAGISGDVFDMEVLDTNGDGILEEDSVLHSGDIIYRPHDGQTQVEAGFYQVPNNRVYVDSDGNGVLDPNFLSARIVVVKEDNLTYVFSQESTQVLAVFPNGTGRSGANTIVSIRRINVELGESWGLEESLRENLVPYPDGSMPNYFGVRTLGTQFYVHEDPSTDIDTFQELHGTFTAHAGSVDGVSLLGTEISGGCIRHRNQDILWMAREVGVHDIALTVETAADDRVDNPFTLYNQTMLAAGLPFVSVSEDVESNTELFPPNRSLREFPVDFFQITNSTRIPFVRSAFPTDFSPIEHPYTRGEYAIIPCGIENMFILSQLLSHSLLIEDAGRFRLRVSSTLVGAHGELIPTNSFYIPTEITQEDVLPFVHEFSGGDGRIQIVEFLVADFVWQYVRFSMGIASTTSVFEDTELFARASTLDNQALREIQLVTGFIAARYNGGERIALQGPLDIFHNRTQMNRLSNIFWGSIGDTYELDPNLPIESDVVPVFDQEIFFPSQDHQFERVAGVQGLGLYEQIMQAVAGGSGVIFRISAFRYLADDSYGAGLSANHYYTLIPEYSDFEAGVIGVYDTMHPYEVLYIPLAQVPSLFTTMTIISPSPEVVTS